MKLKSLLNENMLGDLPSSKLMKMKWNPVTDKKKKVNEEYIEVMNTPRLDEYLDGIKELWLDWKKGPMTEPRDVRPAQKELTDFITKWVKQNIR